MWRFFRRSQRANRDLDALRQDIDTNVHVQPVKELLQNFHVDPKQGLLTFVAKNRLRDQGLNALTPPTKMPKILKIFHRCCGGFSLLIWVIIHKRFNLLHFM